jgi:hypothetical protein
MLCHWVYLEPRASMPSIFTSIPLFWSKTTYKKGLDCDPATSGGRDRKQRNNFAIRCDRKIWRETADGIASDRISSLTNASSSLSTMRGKYSTPGPGVCGSNLIQMIISLAHMRFPTWLRCYLCNSCGGYCGMRWYMLCIYRYVETL